MRHTHRVLSVSLSLSTLLLVAALGACTKHESSGGASADAGSAAPPAAAAGRPLELTPTGKTDPNHGYPTFNIKNVGQKTVTSFSVQVVVNNKAGEKIASSSPSMSPYTPIKPGATLADDAIGTEEMTADTKADFHLFRVTFDDDTSWEDLSQLDQRPVKPAAASAASASATTPTARAASPSKPAAAPPVHLATKK